MFSMKNKKNKKAIEDVILEAEADRRLMPNVPDPSNRRSNHDRRNNHDDDANRPQYATYAGQRYSVHVEVRADLDNGDSVFGTTGDISQTGMMMIVTPEIAAQYQFQKDQHLKLSFQLHEGDLQEGTEKKYKCISAKIMRVIRNGTGLAIQFDHPLYEERRKMDGFLFMLSSLFLFLCTLVILLMRVESIAEFGKNPVLYGYSILTALFLLTRYLFSLFYRPIPVDTDYTPSVTVVIPCFNEQEWIRTTIVKCVDQDYPTDKLEFIIVDDGSSDNSVEVIKKTVQDLCAEGEQYDIKNRVRVFFQKYNQGKREAMGIGIRNCRTELIVFVDSDSFLQPNAIRCLVQPMRDPKTAGVAGRTDVANVYTNHLTKMQAVRYYISFRVMKAAEAHFDAVMCLSGPLSCYRIEAVREVFDKWINQKFMGQKATFGDDRSLTNFVVEHHRTYYQDTAICSTIVPNRHKQFLRQQMRWKRSWLRESLRAGKFIWRKQPFMSFFFYLGLLVPLIAPIIVIYNLIYVPIVRHIFPGTFLMGLFMMSLMMCFAQLILKKSTLWIYGLLFCLYYEFFLLWQMPWAWVTFWVSDWGTRGKGKKRNAVKADDSVGGESAAGTATAASPPQADAQPAGGEATAPAQGQAPANAQGGMQTGVMPGMISQGQMVPPQFSAQPAGTYQGAVYPNIGVASPGMQVPDGAGYPGTMPVQGVQIPGTILVSGMQYATGAVPVSGVQAAEPVPVAGVPYGAGPVPGMQFSDMTYGVQPAPAPAPDVQAGAAVYIPYNDGTAVPNPYVQTAGPVVPGVVYPDPANGIGEIQTAGLADAAGMPITGIPYGWQETGTPSAGQTGTALV